jgi:phage shock protein PspC (stress-responsive transcriptional regulator)
MNNLPQRLSYDKYVGGVLGGIATEFGIDKQALRVIYGIGLVIGPLQLELFILYLVLWAILPSQKLFEDYEQYY